MTPVLVASYDTRGIVLVVQVPGAVCINEHAIGIVHEILMAMQLAYKTRTFRCSNKYTSVSTPSIRLSRHGRRYDVLSTETLVPQRDRLWVSD
jgi:hypothetical protein